MARSCGSAETLRSPHQEELRPGEFRLAIREAVVPSVDPVRHGVHVVAVSQVVERVLLPEPAGDVHGHERVLGDERGGVVLGVVAPRGGAVGGVVGATGELDEAPALESFAVAGLRVPEVDPALVGGAAGDLLGVPELGALVSELREEMGHAQRGVDPVFHHLVMQRTGVLHHVRRRRVDHHSLQLLRRESIRHALAKLLQRRAVRVHATVRLRHGEDAALVLLDGGDRLAADPSVGLQGRQRDELADAHVDQDLDGPDVVVLVRSVPTHGARNAHGLPLRQRGYSPQFCLMLLPFTTTSPDALIVIFPDPFTVMSLPSRTMSPFFFRMILALPDWRTIWSPASTRSALSTLSASFFPTLVWRAPVTETVASFATVSQRFP